MTPAPPGREGGRHPRIEPEDDASYQRRCAQWGGFGGGAVVADTHADLLATLAKHLADDCARREESGRRMFAAVHAAGFRWTYLLPQSVAPATIDFDSVRSVLGAIDRAHATAFDLGAMVVIASRPLHSAADLATVREIFARCHYRSADERRSPSCAGDF